MIYQSTITKLLTGKTWEPFSRIRLPSKYCQLLLVQKCFPRALEVYFGNRLQQSGYSITIWKSLDIYLRTVSHLVQPIYLVILWRELSQYETTAPSITVGKLLNIVIFVVHRVFNSYPPSHHNFGLTHNCRTRFGTCCQGT